MEFSFKNGIQLRDSGGVPGEADCHYVVLTSLPGTYCRRAALAKSAIPCSGSPVQKRGRSGSEAQIGFCLKKFTAWHWSLKLAAKRARAGIRPLVVGIVRRGDGGVPLCVEGDVTSAPPLSPPSLALPRGVEVTAPLTLSALPQPTWKPRVPAVLFRVILKKICFFPLINFLTSPVFNP